MSNLDVSPDQLGAIMVGGKHQKSFQPVSEDAWKEWGDLPSWVLDAHVDWMEGYGNDPRYLIKIAPNAFDRGALGWYKRGEKTWIAEHPDGWCKCHYHNGPVTLRTAKDFKGYEKDETGEVITFKPIYEDRLYIGTTKQAGYGGRHFPIVMADDSDIYPGQTVELVGPWHGGAPEGYIDVTIVEWDERTQQQAEWRRKHSKWPNAGKWFRAGGTFGIYLKKELVLAIMAVHQPHLRFCDHDLGYAKYLHPLRPETGMPKGWYLPKNDGHAHVFRGQPGDVGKPHERCFICNISRKTLEMEMESNSG